MTVFPDWQKYVVFQRRPLSGCIPTGYEMLLRAAHMTDVDFSTFQGDFDPDKNLKQNELPKNNFDSVARAVNEKYPHIRFKRDIFPKEAGVNKLQYIEDAINNCRLVLVSLNMQPIANHPGWHIMPVVDIDDVYLYLMYAVGDDGQIQLLRLSKADFVKIHEDFAGGDHIAYLDT